MFQSQNAGFMVTLLALNKWNVAGDHQWFVVFKLYFFLVSI